MSSLTTSPRFDVLGPEPARNLLLTRAGRSSIDANMDACDELAERIGHARLSKLRRMATRAAQTSASKIISESTRSPHTSFLAKESLGRPSSTTPCSLRGKRPPRSSRPRLVPFCVCPASLPRSPIPIKMFSADTEAVRILGGAFDRESDATLSDSPSNDMFIRDAAQDLARYSMIRMHGHTFTIHRLIQTVERLDTSAASCTALVDIATAYLLHYAPSESYSASAWTRWDLLQPHASELLRSAESIEDVATECGLLNTFGGYLLGKGSYTRAESLFRRAIGTAEARLILKRVWRPP